jgi:hypothetical protein
VLSISYQKIHWNRVRQNHSHCVHLTNFNPARWYCALGIYSQFPKSDFAGALRYYERAHSLAESIGYPTLVGKEALNCICNVLILTGKPLSALKYAKEAYRCAEHTGNMYGQARSLWLQGRCHIVLAKYWPAQYLLQKSRDMVAACGQQQSVLGIYILNERLRSTS